MHKVLDVLNLGWVQFLLFVGALGGVPGIVLMWDRIHRAQPVTVTAPPLTAPVTTGSTEKPAKKSPAKVQQSEKSFFEDPLGWFSRPKRDCSSFAQYPELTCEQKEQIKKEKEMLRSSKRTAP